MALFRADKLRESFKSIGIDAVLVSNPYNRRYLTNFTGTYGCAIIGRKKNVLITDSRYVEQARAQCKEFEIVEQKKGTYETILSVLQSINVENLGFEEDFITFHRYKNYIDSFKNVNLVPSGKSIEKLRGLKDSYEISKIRKAAQIADSAFSYILEVIKPGISELDIALELEFYMKKNGASALSFDTIVASGLRSSMPHGIASNKIIQYGDAITLDFGCVFEGYCSDMTRTVFVGKAEDKLREIYNIVLKAQVSALKALKAGAISKEVDNTAREIITNRGYGDNFGHSLGHSVGLEVHEEPRLSPKNESVVQVGMVLTVEPGIYREGVGGVRIEDMVVVTENGYDNFVTSPKELIIL